MIDSSMERRHRQIEELLLELHMGSISDQDRVWLESQLQQHPNLGEQCDRIGDVLRPLDHWTAGAMPEGVISKTLDRVARVRETEQPADDVGSEASGYRFAALRWRELLAVAACLGLLVGAALPSLFEMRDRSRRATCAANLGTISQGTKLYQASFGGSLPYAGVVRNASWLPTSLSSGPLASNSRHMFLLAKRNFGPAPKNFVCPSSGHGKPMPVEAMASYDDFAQLDNISYASQNLSGASPNLRPTQSIAYAGDPNPLFARGRFDDSIDPDSANSPAHGGRGQMVMTLDGSTRWMTTPVYGASHDNVWLIGDLRRYNGTESPSGHDDSQLVPGFPTTDPKVRAMLAR